MENYSSMLNTMPKDKRRQPPRVSDGQLATEFKTAATAVARLFNLSANRLNEAFDQGYANALTELLESLSADPDLDVKEWAERQLMDLTGDLTNDLATKPWSQTSDQVAVAARDDRAEAQRADASGPVYSEQVLEYDTSDDDRPVGEKRLRYGLMDTKRPRPSQPGA